jgi:hypothetical protein
LISAEQEQERRNRMADHNCVNCAFRAKYDKNPRSLLGRIWRWHAGWCPGWKKYIMSLPEDERIALAERYDLKKYGKTG